MIFAVFLRLLRVGLLPADVVSAAGRDTARLGIYRLNATWCFNYGYIRRVRMCPVAFTKNWAELQ